jgi:protein TonB
MSYLNQVQDPRRRAGALAGTIAINAAIGIIVVTGLTISGLAPKKDTYEPILQFPTAPPPPEPMPSPSVDAIQPPPAAPIPPLPLPTGHTAAPFDTTSVIPKVIPRVDPGPIPAPTPRPAPSFTPTVARPSNNSASWITADDYPRRSLVDGSEGLARYRLVIGTKGQVSSCEITASTGDRRLDQATCRFLTRRARFEAATDETGAKVVGTYSGSVRWQIPD